MDWPNETPPMTAPVSPFYDAMIVRGGHAGFSRALLPGRSIKRISRRRLMRRAAGLACALAAILIPPHWASAFPLNSKHDGLGVLIRVADVIDGHVHPSLCVTEGGDVLAVFNRQGGGGKELLLCRSADGGRTWSEPAPIPGIEDCSIYPGSLTTLADGRILLNWSCYRGLAGAEFRTPQFCISNDAGRAWSTPKAYPLQDLTNYSCLRHAILELSPTEWVLPLYDRTVVYDPRAGRITPFGDGRNHGMVPIVRTKSGTLISGAPVANSGVSLVLPRDAVRGLRSTDGGRTWQALHALPYFGVAGYDLTVLDNGWIVVTSIVYGVGQDGEWAYELIVSRDDGQTWDTARAVPIYNPGRRIGGRGWPRTAQLDAGTLGTLFYDLDPSQAGGPGLFFVRTPMESLGVGGVSPRR